MMPEKMRARCTRPTHLVRYHGWWFALDVPTGFPTHESTSLQSLIRQLVREASV